MRLPIGESRAGARAERTRNIGGARRLLGVTRAERGERARLC